MNLERILGARTADLDHVYLAGYGVGHIDVTGYPNWAWIFLLNGALTILAGIVFLIVAPNSPETARFLTAAERKVALERVRVNQSSLDNRTV